MLASLHPPTEYALAEFPSLLEEERQETVPMARLDTFLRSWRSPVDNPRLMLKIDVQGAEGDVLAGLGMRSTTSR